MIVKKEYHLFGTPFHFGSGCLFELTILVLITCLTGGYDFIYLIFQGLLSLAEPQLR